MFNVLMLLVLTGSIDAAWYEGNDSDVYLRGGGGGKREGQSSLQQLAVPTNPPVHNPHITIGMQQNRIEVVNLRGRMEAQNIDVNTRRGWWRCLTESLGRWCSNMCGSRPRPLTPTARELPPLSRTYSVYPGR